MRKFIRGMPRILVFIISTVSIQSYANTQFTSCLPQAEDEPKLYMEDFKQNQTYTEVKERFDVLYNSGKRLKNRAFYNQTENSLIVPLKVSFKSERNWARVPDSFIESIRKHIETSLKLKYAEWVFFSDMGHSHFFVPRKIWDKKFNDIPLSEKARLYETMMLEPELRVQYHTAEQMRLTDEDKWPIQDRWLMWRHHTRNPMGYNNGKSDIDLFFSLDTFANTVGEIPGYFRYGAGFSISASRDGCFEYQEPNTLEMLRFDLSYEDIESSGFVGDY